MLRNRPSSSTAVRCVVRHTHNVLPNAILFHQQLSHGLLSDVPKRLDRQQLARRRAELLFLIAFHYQGGWLVSE